MYFNSLIVLLFTDMKFFYFLMFASVRSVALSLTNGFLSQTIYSPSYSLKHDIETRSYKDTVITHKARLSISIGDEDFGQIVVGLFGEDAPKTTQNFVELCQDNSVSKEIFKGLKR